MSEQPLQLLDLVGADVLMHLENREVRPFLAHPRPVRAQPRSHTRVNANGHDPDVDHVETPLTTVLCPATDVALGRIQAIVATPAISASRPESITG